MKKHAFSFTNISNEAVNNLTGKWKKVYCSTLLLLAITILAFVVSWSFIFAGAVLLLFIGAEVVYIHSLSSSNPKNLEDVVNIKKWNATTVIVPIILALATIVGFLLLIVPGIIILMNYQFVFQVMAENPDAKCLEVFKLAKEKAKHYRWKMFWVNFVFCFFLLAFVSVGICLLVLIAFLFRLNMMYCIWIGLMLGLSFAFLIMFPVYCESVTVMYNTITEDRLYKEKIVDMYTKNKTVKSDGDEQNSAVKKEDVTITKPE